MIEWQCSTDHLTWNCQKDLIGSTDFLLSLCNPLGSGIGISFTNFKTHKIKQRVQTKSKRVKTRSKNEQNNIDEISVEVYKWTKNNIFQILWKPGIFFYLTILE